jgi:hypothetical protein
MVGWIAYLLGWIAGMVGGPETAAILIVGGMVAHWRFWLLAIPFGAASFLLGFHWKG